MKLAFNAIGSGLGNNGGSRTIILCSETLNQLGHRCDIVSSVDNFTWFDHKPTLSYVPMDIDVLIATACTTVELTKYVKLDIKKAWYIRGHENWMMPDDRLGKLYNIGLFNIVNSYGMNLKLSEYGAKSVVVYQGIDLDFWHDENLREGKIRIGCLYNKKPTKRWEDFATLSSILGNKDFEYIGIGDSMRNDSFLKFFWANASREELIDIYSSCDYWFVPTELEGLHNIPMEAGLCGCRLVCTNHLMSGTVDYTVDGLTAMVYEARDIEQAAELIKNPTVHDNEELLNIIKNKIGNRRTNMIRLVKKLEDHYEVS